jgi:hypothetical protein
VQGLAAAVIGALATAGTGRVGRPTQPVSSQGPGLNLFAAEHVEAPAFAERTGIAQRRSIDEPADETGVIVELFNRPLGRIR